jgi:hypothetical protein
MSITQSQHIQMCLEFSCENVKFVCFTSCDHTICNFEFWFFHLTLKHKDSLMLFNLKETLFLVTSQLVESSSVEFIAMEGWLYNLLLC